MGGPADSLDNFMSRTGSTRGVFKQNGEIIGKPHPTMKKSYADNSNAREVPTSTTNASFTDPRRKAPLVKYHPNALRNRLPVEFKDAAIPCVRFCHPRNQHTYECVPPSALCRGPAVRGGREREREPEGALSVCTRRGGHGAARRARLASRARSRGANPPPPLVPVVPVGSRARAPRARAPAASSAAARRPATSASARRRKTFTSTTRRRSPWASPTRVSSQRSRRTSTSSS